MKRKYRLKTRHVWADVYKSGVEDGFSCIPYADRCMWKDDKGNYKRCQKCPLEIRKLPYILGYFTEKGSREVKVSLQFISAGDYILIDDLGRKFVCTAFDFMNNYEPINNRK